MNIRPTFWPLFGKFCDFWGSTITEIFKISSFFGEKTTFVEKIFTFDFFYATWRIFPEIFMLSPPTPSDIFFSPVFGIEIMTASLSASHESFFKMVEKIFLITVGFKTKKGLLSLFRCQCDFLQTKWKNFRWCFTQLFPNFFLETAISQFWFSISREGMKSQKETKKAFFWWRMVG